MCGIVGVWHRSGAPVDPAALSAMLTTVQHRGPDDAGNYVEGSLGLAHRRLAIIDLSQAGKQPMTTPDGRFTIVFNGEIYNYQELKDRYLKGVVLRSASDTEVLLNLLARQGVEALSELRGMFAFALWDRERKELTLACDPFGKKPLYYLETPDLFLCASEAKAILAHPGVDRSIDRAALTKYFLYEYVPSPATAFREVRQLSAGHSMRVTQDSLVIERWWQPQYRPKYHLAEKEALQQLDAKLEIAVRRRMIADVPVGVFLSGGIDSTTIAWYMKQVSTVPLHSFSVSFHEHSFDETQYAREAAQALGTVHHETQFGLTEFHQALGSVLQLLDIPFADASLLPTYVVSKLARPEVTVVLDGDGSDELFGGYGTFSAAQFSLWLERMPAFVWRLLSAAARRLPTRYDYFSFDFKLKSFLRGMPYSLPYRNQIWLGSFSDAELKHLLMPAWQSSVATLFSDIEAVLPELPGLDSIDQISLLTVKHYLHSAILVKLDRATMYTSLEARTPFLDVDLAQFIMRLPIRLKRNKYLLKKLMRGRIPEAIIDRPKQGFAVPLGFWLRGPLYEWACEILSESRLTADGILQPIYVQQLLTEHKDGKADHRKKLWTLLMFQLWYDRWVKQRR
jgi:asparagine synthase (glutamine-hydrolysing)